MSSPSLILENASVSANQSFSKVLISNFGSDIKKQRITKLFSKAGILKSVSLLTNEKTTSTIAIAEYTNSQDAATAVDTLNLKIIDTWSIQVEPWSLERQTILLSVDPSASLKFRLSSSQMEKVFLNEIALIDTQLNDIYTRRNVVDKISKISTLRQKRDFNESEI